jgi:signal transduction histidine kinase
VLVLALAASVIYRNVRHEIDKEQGRELQAWVNELAAKIERGHSIEKLNKAPVEIRERSLSDPNQSFTMYDTIAIHRQHQRPERHLKGKASYKIGGKHYQISTYDIMVETDDIVDAIKMSLMWIVGILLLLLIISARMISIHILRPFHTTLQSIQSFRINEFKTLNIGSSRTKEIHDLNVFLQSMTEKARIDYLSLKEFSESASHEMQTPLAIIRGKLELLMESGINDEQAKSIASAHDAVEKLSRMGQALTLLTKLNNHEFITKEHLNIASLLQSKTETFDDLCDLKGLTIERQLEQNIFIQMNATLADILFNNLFSNAIRHNIEKGHIIVILEQSKVVIRNTGPSPTQSPSEMFKRFKKDTPGSDSIGLGLSIAQRICELHSFPIDYTFDNGWHQIQVRWNNQ